MDQVKGSTAPTVRTCHIQDGAQSPGQTQWAACGKVGGLLGTRDTPELLLPYVTSFPQMTAHNDITQMGPSPKEPAFPRSFVPTSIKPRADGKEGGLRLSGCSGHAPALPCATCKTGSTQPSPGENEPRSEGGRMALGGGFPAQSIRPPSYFSCASKTNKASLLNTAARLRQRMSPALPVGDVW